MELRRRWTHALLVVFYFIIVFIISRLFDAYLWFVHGATSIQTIDPIVLSVRQLKQLLDYRGVSYTGCIEKPELVELLKNSGDTVKRDTETLKTETSANKAIQIFENSADFYHQVEDTEDTIWLVHVIPSSGCLGSVLSIEKWDYLSSYLNTFSIRTGIYHCERDNRICDANGWDRPLLLLSIPKIGKAKEEKEKVQLRQFSSSNFAHIIEYIHQQLAAHIHNISSIQELENEWLSSPSTYSGETKVLLLTHLIHSPLFLAALTIKFRGRVKFGIFSSKEDCGQLQKKLKLKNHTLSFPSYLIISSSGITAYGKQKPQYINFKSMDSYLGVLRPKADDVFLASLMFINMVTYMQVVQFIQNYTFIWNVFWIIGRIIWLAFSINFWSLFIWVLLFSIVNWPLVNSVCNFSIYLLQLFGLSNVGSLFIADILILLQYPGTFISSYMIYGYIALKVIRHYLLDMVDTPPEESTWWGDLLPFEAFVFDSLFSTNGADISDEELEERIENILASLPVPNFWLEPTVPGDYIKDLPVWIYKEEVDKEMETLTELMDDPNAEPIKRIRNSVKVVTACVKSECRMIYDQNRGGYGYCSECLQSKQQDKGLRDIIPSTDCSICLDSYRSGVYLCGLPCGHAFHKDCIYTWLEHDNHDCPICRWPAYKYIH